MIFNSISKIDFGSKKSRNEEQIITLSYCSKGILKSFEPPEILKQTNKHILLMRGSSHIRSVLIGVKYRNCCQTLDVYLLTAISIGQIQSKPISKL